MGNEDPFDVRREQVGGRRTEIRSTRWRHRLEARSDVHHVAHRRVVVGARDRPHHHFTGVDTDPQLELLIQPDLADVAIQRGVHLDRSPDRPIRVVLVCDRGPEQGQDAIAEHLVDPTAEPFDLVDQRLECSLDHPFDPLGVDVFRQRGVTDQIREEHGDHPPLLDGARTNLVPTEGAEPRSLRKGLRTRHARHQPLSVRHVSPQADE